MTNLSPIEAGSARRIASSKPAAERESVRGTAKPRRGDDRVEVSDAARFLAKMNAMPEVRSELVNEVRAQIADGTYDTPEKMDLAIDSMIEELG